ncbi:MAG: hypothetical protein R3E36_06340 [Nitrosomonas sp.]|nr:hypothetical protein [Nitrosomonas sp.]MDR4651978.1 hypothetical protein [Nitrosomonas sp.]
MTEYRYACIAVGFRFFRLILPNASAIGYQSRKSIYFVVHLNTQNSVTLFRELGKS